MSYPGLVFLSDDEIRDLGLSKMALKGLLEVQSESYTGKVTTLEQSFDVDGGILVPRAFMDFRFYKPEDGEQGMVMNHSRSAEMSLRPYQKTAVQSIKTALLQQGGAILVGGCGTGKTVMGSFLIHEIGLRALVLVHKEFLMQQFADTLRLAYPGIKVGFWCRDDVPDGSEDVVIAMVQSICTREYAPDCYQGFGMVVTDEVHRFSAPLWSKAIARFGAAYRLGLTATPERSDGLQSVFLNSIGPIAHEIKGNLLQPSIYLRKTRATYLPHSFRQYDGQPSTAKLINLIAGDDDRNARISDSVETSIRARRTPLVLVDRRSQAATLQHILSGRLPDSKICLYLGGMKKADREFAEKEADCIIGTYSMAQEGLDIPRLDTLFLASPKTNVAQAIGRILRPSPGKKDPFVVDFVDEDVFILRNYYKKRLRYYEAEGWSVYGKLV